MKKIIFLLFLLCFIGNVNAIDINDSFYYDNEKVESMWITRVKGNNVASGNPYILKRVSDNKYVYCLEPFSMLKKYENYEGYYSNQEKFHISSDALNKINLYAYYGYQYPGHEDIKWYGITQYLIWKTIDPSADIYFTDARFGNRIIAYESEVNELENLVLRHNLLPSFSEIEHVDTYDSEIILTDSNNVLDNYDIVDSNNLEVKKNGNELVLTVDKIGNYQISLTQKKLRNTNSEWILYYHDSGQNVILPGQIDFNNANVKLKIIDGFITLKKEDYDGNHYNGTSLEGAQYGVYDNEVLVDTIVTDKDGVGQSKRLPIKKYIIKELTPSLGYELDTNIYNSNLTLTEPNGRITVYEKVIRNDITINKKYGSNKLNLYYDEAGATFEIYDINNTLVATISTDINGKSQINLTYGKYRFHQIKGQEHFKFVNDFWVNIDENSLKKQNIYIINDEEEGKGNLSIIKHGENKELLANVKFHIYAAQDIISPLGIIYYKKGDLVTDIVTNNEGSASIDLYNGLYELIEYETNKGYILDTNKKIFEIDNTSVTLELDNQKEIDVPDTYQKQYNGILTIILMIWGVIFIIHGQKDN